MSNLRLYLIAMVHLSVGTSIVAISSFVNAELTFAEWSPDQISFYLGIPILFELFRVFFSHLYDTKNILRPSLIIGLLASAVGIFALPYFITPPGNILISVMVSLFYLGSSILTTLIDSNLTLLSEETERSKTAGIIQTFRLTGFAVGGIIGSILYSRLEFKVFITALGVFYTILGTITLLSVIKVEREVTENGKFSESLRSLLGLISGGMPLLMTIFLFLYPIGLFMQDLILEPFAIDNFNFGEENVGRVVAIWTSLTLVFVPIGVFLASKIDRMLPIISGAIIATAGLLLFSFSAFINNVTIFYVGLVFFGIGNGISSAPAIGMMLDVCAIKPRYLSLLLAFFGIMTTLGRSSAAILGGIILNYSGNSYTLLFFIEAIFVIVSYTVLIPLNRKLREITITAEIDPIQVSAIDLN